MALVTGAARGIGLAIARAMAAEGAWVVLTDVRDELGTSAAREIGSGARYLRLDVRREDDWARVMGEVSRGPGPLSVLCNNAGITGLEPPDAALPDQPPPGPHEPERVSLEAWRGVMATNVEGALLGCRHAMAAMSPPGGRGGSIVNISSRSAIVGVAGAAAYAASKAALASLSRSVAMRCAQLGVGVRCNSVHPASVLTPMWEPMLAMGDREATLRELAAEIPLGRMGTPEDVARVCVFLASDDAAFITGASVHVDGGMLACDGRPIRVDGG